MPETGPPPQPAPAGEPTIDDQTIPPIRLVVSDVDGTLLTSDKRLTDEAVAAARRLEAAGISLMLTSARPPRGLRMLIDPLRITMPLAAFNGGVIVAPDLSVLEKRVIPDRIVAPLTRLLPEHGVDVWVYTATDWYVSDGTGPHLAREAAVVGVMPEPTSSIGQIRQVVKVVGVGDDPAALAAAARSIGDRFEGEVLAVNSQPYYLDITHPGANKGSVVDYAIRRMGVPARSVAVIGDMANDLLMFDKAGLSIAMGNAPPEVRARADLVTSGNDEDGFANAIDRYVLGRSGIPEPG